MIGIQSIKTERLICFERPTAVLIMVWIRLLSVKISVRSNLGKGDLCPKQIFSVSLVSALTFS
jgi:hypothetical protein